MLHSHADGAATRYRAGVTSLRRVWPILRLTTAMLIVAAVIAQAARTVGNAAAAGQDVATTTANFFSFFTIQSNILTAAVFVWAAVWALTRGGDARTEPRWMATALACVTTYMLITGIVYNILLRGIPQPPGAVVEWSNTVLHVVAPAFLLVDLVIAPRRRPLPWRVVAEVLAFPVAWIVYTLVRGPLVTAPGSGEGWWYPYPFLDPHNFANGYGTVSVYIAGIAVAIIAVAWAGVWTGRFRSRRVAVHA